MATILNGDIQVDHFADNRQKRLSWLGGTNTTYTMNQLYSAMATYLDETTTIDDGTCFSAETPTEYTIGKIDSGDTEPWYITFDLMEHITGGALRTSGWTRVQDSNTGIVCVAVSPGGAIVAGDEGFDITHSDGDAGTLLEFIDTGGTYDYCLIRPDSSGVANSFDAATSDTLTCNGHVANIVDTVGIATTGDQIWANLYSIGTIDPNAHIYLYQGGVATDGNRVRLASWNDATQDWFDDYQTNGHIDTCVALKDIEQSTWTIIDGGYITAFARKSGDLYSSFEVACSTTSGGRNPIPLQTSTDLDQGTGIKKIDTGTWTGTYTDGEIITGNSTGARGIVDLTNSTADDFIVYFPIDDPQVDFTTSDTVITGASSGATSSAGGGAGTTDYGPATAAWFTNTTTPTISFTYDGTADIDDDGTTENYAITINCQSNPLTEVYEWCKYATRNGETTNDLDGINGESYIGGEVYIAFSSETTAFTEGDDVTQETTGATGVIVAYDSTAKVMLLRDTRGTFATGAAGSHTITTTDPGSGEVEVDAGAGVEVSTFAPKTASPLGTFAGGTFFGARGVLLTGYLDADANSFILTPMEGGTKERPASLTLSVSNLSGGAATSALHDRVAVFRRTGASGDINKTEYACTGGEAAGAATISSATSITSDTVGKTDGGTLVLIDASDGGAEYKIRYSSWSSTTDDFTLNEITGTATAGTGDTTLKDSGKTFTSGADQVYRGDLVYVAGRGWAYVETVDDANTLTLAGSGISGFVSTDAYEINVPPVAITSSDYIYVPFMDRVATSDTESVSVFYTGSTVYYRGKVRNTRATTKIKPFSVDGSFTSGDVSIPTIRTEDTIIT